jgi:hypothetical protein
MQKYVLRILTVAFYTNTEIWESTTDVRKHRSLTAYTISPRRQFLQHNGLSPLMENDHAIRTNFPAQTFSLVE